MKTSFSETGIVGISVRGDRKEPGGEPFQIACDEVNNEGRQIPQIAELELDMSFHHIPLSDLQFNTEIDPCQD